MAPLFQTQELAYIAPEILLSVWGLLVLVADFTFLRKAEGAVRVKALGRLSLVGTFLALLLAIFSILSRSSEIRIPFYNSFALDLGAQDWRLFAGTLAADSATAMMNVLVLALLMLVIGLSMTWNFTEHWGEYFSLLLWSAVGMMLLIAAEELLTLFLTLETMTLCLYMTAAFEKARRRSAEAGLKYFVYGSVSSALFLFGLSLLYGLTGTTRFDAIRLAIGSIGVGGLENNVAAATSLLLIMVGFGFKIAAVPFQQWAPDTYEGAPAPVTAWIASGSKVASFVALMKVLLGALPFWAYSKAGGSGNLSTPGWIGILAVISAASMTYGNFAALAQKNLKRMLAYSSIAHAGYLLVGVIAASASVSKSAAAGAVLFYLVVYSFTTVGAFAVAAWLARDKGSDDIADLNGLGFRSPALAVCILLLMLSLIGMPPLGGFFGKLYMFMEAMNTGRTSEPQAWFTRQTLTWLVALGLFNSVVSAFYYVRVLKAMFLRQDKDSAASAASSGVSVPIVAATLVAIGMGLYPGPLIGLMKGAAVSMLSPGSSRSFATEIDPSTILTDEQRLEKNRKLLEEDIRNGRVIRPAGGTVGGGPPPARGTPRKDANPSPPESPKAPDAPSAKPKSK